ncbi:MAG TPA: hypothetical protein VJB59_06535 [Bdellovibrionota bacterium]|nr:hypothetical protein [Bdellovibrionota bacterium]
MNRFLWITDPWHFLDHGRDTTLRLAREALELGFPSYWCSVRTIRWEKNRVLLDAHPLVPGPSVDRSEIHPGPARVSHPGEFHCIHYRMDPPVDFSYLHPLQLLSQSVSGKKNVEIVNSPDVLFSTNEKIEGLLLKNVTPPSVVASQWDYLLSFGKKEGRTVLKPLHLCQSKGVELLDWRSQSGIEEARTVIARETENFRNPVLLQRFLEGISEGEQRLWFIDGKLLAHVRKLPVGGDFRVNVDRGSRIEPSQLSARENRTARLISKNLRSRGIRLAAVDLIEGHVTDFNFTSPGLLCQMESVLGRNLARPIIKKLAKNRPF